MRRLYNNIKKRVVKYWILDAALLAVLLSISGFAIWSYVQALPDPLDHNFHPLLSLLYPSIFFAAGHELGTTDIKQFPEINEFVSRKTDSLDLSILPENLTLQPPKTAYELSHLYLLYAVGWVWRLAGVSVGSLMLLVYAFYVLNGAFLYFLFRHFVQPVIAFVAVLLTILAPPFLTTSISLRDYSKGPFVLLFLVLLVWLAKNRNHIPRMLLLSVACASVLGIGSGFRQDCLTGIPLFVAAVLILLPWSRQRHPLLLRLGALTLFAATFTVLAWPVLAGISMEGGAVNAHTFAQGISTEAESTIALGEASYEIVPNTWDTTTYSTIVTYARRTGNTDPMINPHSAEYQKVMGNADGPLRIDPQLYFTGKAYGQSGHQYILEIARLFPADLFLRAVTTIAHLFEAPHRSYGLFEASSAHQRGLLSGLHAVNRATAQFLFQAYGVLIAIFVLALFLKPRIETFFFVFVLLYLMSYPSILLQERHYYHLTFVPYLLLFGLVSLFPRVFAIRPISALISLFSRKSMFWGALAGGAILLGITLSATVLRAWQHHQVDLLADQIYAADREPIAYSVTVSEGIAHIAPLDTLPQLRNAASLPPGEVAWEYLMIAVNAGGKDIPVSIEYDKDRSAHDLSSTYTVRAVPRGKNAEVFFCFPVYEIDLVYSPSVVDDVKRLFPKQRDFFDAEGQDFYQQERWKRGRFIGISLPAELLRDFKGFYRLSGKLPNVLPFISIPQDRQHFVRHKSTPAMRQNIARYFEFRMLANLGRCRAEKAYAELLARYPNEIWMLKRYNDLLYRLRPPADYIETVATTAALFDSLKHHAAVFLAESGDRFEKNGNPIAAYNAYMAAATLVPSEKWYAIRLEQLSEYAGRGAP